MTQHIPVGAQFQGIAAVSSEQATVDFSTLLWAIWRGKWIISGTVSMAVFLMLYYLFSVSVSIYQSTAVVILETQQNSVVDLQSVMGGLSGDISTVNSEVEVLRARGLMTKVADQLALANDPEFNATLRNPSLKAIIRNKLEAFFEPAPPNSQNMSPQILAKREQDMVISALLSRTTVRNVPLSLVFQITVETTNPEKSALIADTIAEFYILDQIDVKFRATEQATRWLTNRVAELQVQLEDAEARIANFSTSADFVSLATLQTLEKQLKDLRRRIAGAREFDSDIARQMNRFAAANTRSQQAIAANDPELNQMWVSTKNGVESENAFDAKFQLLRDRIDLDALRSSRQLIALTKSEADLNIQLDHQNENLITLQQLTRDAEANRLLYEYFLGRLKETSAQQGIQKPDSRILSNAVIPTFPSSPKKSLLVSMSAIFGGIAGLCFILVRQLRNVSFRSAKELEEHSGQMVLGQIPTIPARGRKNVLSYLLKNPASVTAEAIRNLRTSAFHCDKDKFPQVIMLTSSLPGEGKTTITLALAHNLAGMGKKVLVIEGDVRRRMFHRYFGTLPNRGLASVLKGTLKFEDAVVKVGGFGADILVGEPCNTSAADVFSSAGFKSMITVFRGHYDVILIDTPPVLVVPDARIIAPLVDAVFLTVKWDATTKPQVEEALRMFRTGQVNVSGMILSQINAKGMKRYGYGRHHGTYPVHRSEYHIG